MIQTQHDERRRRRLLTQKEVCQIAGCSTVTLQYHARHGWIAEPTARLHARYYYTEEQATEIAAYYASRKRWQRGRDEQAVRKAETTARRRTDG